ncbi:hypothetical protein AMAG_06336 [Allomyces macrogynus ATCC 38327]|uniref:Diacylglycerol O-acyltransferase n=1 Tax=Allomyces macrogynus (strain ATCC 38327) TaxID=578462 RepID=A0A0L0SG88_ALLM3|nr:hypothetical protein, variant [Allomyces macrogynus ATCC 38327]KNE61519.1 hypothetical protein AMAG_06336 [Allomyces macrogynus ATCC 38327]|eukprot:KNE61518.1 hypothetical protein, variant [Allomyces macrogynus ATCC 38327]
MSSFWFASLRESLERTKPTIGMLIWLLIMDISPVLSLVLLYFHTTRVLFFAYVAWVWLWDKAPEAGGRRFDYVRRMQHWKWMAAYFPVEIRKDGELDPNRSYIVGCHPHGIMTFGAWINFGTEATGFSDLFPGIKLSMLTLSANFKLPILRDLLMALGMASVSRKSIESIIRQGPGHSVAIVIGGAQESLHAAPRTLDLVLKKRLGFIKVAILNGALLVPALTFGENDVFDLSVMPDGSLGWRMQQWSKRTLGWAMSTYRGRRVFPLGTLPYQHRIMTVMGKAVDPEEVVGHPIDPQNLTRNELVEITDKVHRAYIDRIYEVWNKYKDELAPHRIKELELVE